MEIDTIISRLSTEQRNDRTRNIDQKSTEEIIRLINAEDRLIAETVESVIPQIAAATELIVQSFREGGKLLYFGAGTSGRLGILDASECPPTYGTDPKLIQGIIAGGDSAIKVAVEGAEDSETLGSHDVDVYDVTSKDTLVGIAASGRTPYVIGAMKRARDIGANVIGISNNYDSPMTPYANIMIEAVVGPEVVLGSTRMKAGTAQKMILNMLSTASMIRTGKVYDNLMVDVQVSNEKLASRAKRLIQMATGADDHLVGQAFEAANGHVKTAIIMILADVDIEQALQLLERSGGFVRKAIEKIELTS